MCDYRPGELVLLSFPFVETTRAKRRPALVLLDTGDDDIVVARVTSQVVRSSFDIEIAQWQRAGLVLRSWARLHKLASVKKQLVVRRLGALATEDWARARAKIREIWCPP